MVIVNIIAFILVVLGSLNWALVGIFGYNIVTAIFGAAVVGSLITYIIIALAAIWLIVYACMNHGKIYLNRDER